MQPKFIALPGAQGVNLAHVTRWASGPHPERPGDWALAVYFLGESTPAYYTGDAANKILATLADLAGLNLPGDAVTDNESEDN